MLGLLAFSLSVVVLETFLLVALIVWFTFQALLANHVRAGESIRPLWLTLAQVSLLLSTLSLLGLVYEVVRVSGDSGLPSVKEGEWLLVSGTGGGLPRLGDGVAVRCVEPGSTTLARVVGLPGDRLHGHGKAVCRNGQCYPSAPMVLEDGKGGETVAAATFVGGRSHVLLSSTEGVGALPRDALPMTIPDAYLALLPDNRASASFASCSGGEMVLPVDRVVGSPQAILYSSDWARIGLSLE